MPSVTQSHQLNAYVAVTHGPRSRRVAFPRGARLRGHVRAGARAVRRPLAGLVTPPVPVAVTGALRAVTRSPTGAYSG